jgi:hypothetical protein
LNSTTLARNPDKIPVLVTTAVVVVRLRFSVFGDTRALLADRWSLSRFS